MARHAGMPTQAARPAMKTKTGGFGFACVSSPVRNKGCAGASPMSNQARLHVCHHAGVQHELDDRGPGADHSLRGAPPVWLARVHQHEQGGRATRGEALTCVRQWYRIAWWGERWWLCLRAELRGRKLRHLGGWWRLRFLRAGCWLRFLMAKFTGCTAAGLCVAPPQCCARPSTAPALKQPTCCTELRTNEDG